MAPPAHPNEFDRKRIDRAIRQRRRYRYVEPKVVGADHGYRIESACCSRNVDPDGGVVDIALVLHDADSGNWHLFRKNHGADTWELDSTHPRLPPLLDLLNEDQDRKFWQ